MARLALIRGRSSALESLRGTPRTKSAWCCHHATTSRRAAAGEGKMSSDVLAPIEGADRLFGPWTIAKGEIFAESGLSFAFVNLKPVVSGHVLIAPKRVCKRFAQMTNDEVADLWQLAKVVGNELELNAHVLFPDRKGGNGGDTKAKSEYSLTLCIQDGPQAGQTVPHVHVHILPRKEGDFENNDQIYDEIDDAEMSLSKQLDNDERKARTPAEMEEEAEKLRRVFYS